MVTVENKAGCSLESESPTALTLSSFSFLFAVYIQVHRREVSKSDIPPPLSGISRLSVSSHFSISPLLFFCLVLLLKIAVL